MAGPRLITDTLITRIRNNARNRDDPSQHSMHRQHGILIVYDLLPDPSVMPFQLDSCPTSNPETLAINSLYTTWEISCTGPHAISCQIGCLPGAHRRSHSMTSLGLRPTISVYLPQRPQMSSGYSMSLCGNHRFLRCCFTAFRTCIMFVCFVRRN